MACLQHYSVSIEVVSFRFISNIVTSVSTRTLCDVIFNLVIMYQVGTDLAKRIDQPRKSLVGKPVSEKCSSIIVFQFASMASL
jgi:hypothetical protein